MAMCLSFIAPAQPGLYLVKRVMGVPGDRIHLQDGVVYRNGEALNEPYVAPTRASITIRATATTFRACPPASTNS